MSTFYSYFVQINGYVSAPSQMGKMYVSLCPLMALLILGIPGAHSAKCPKFCVCDAVELTVACVNKNLTAVPPTIDEVRWHSNWWA